MGYTEKSLLNQAETMDYQCRNIIKIMAQVLFFDNKGHDSQKQMLPNHQSQLTWQRWSKSMTWR
jgi:hypothetical protein